MQGCRLSFYFRQRILLCRFRSFFPETKGIRLFLQSSHESNFVRNISQRRFQALSKRRRCASHQNCVAAIVLCFNAKVHFDPAKKRQCKKQRQSNTLFFIVLTRDDKRSDAAVRYAVVGTDLENGTLQGPSCDQQILNGGTQRRAQPISGRRIKHNHNTVIFRLREEAVLGY